MDEDESICNRFAAADSNRDSTRADETASRRCAIPVHFTDCARDGENATASS
jgi:hypothetical protein